MDEEKKEAEEKSEVFTKLKSNPWIISTVIVAVIALVLAIMLFSKGGVTGNVIAVDDAGQKAVDLVGKVFGVELEYLGGQEANGLYDLSFKLENQTLDLKATKDFTFLSLPNGQWLRTADYAASLTGNVVADDSSDNSQEPPATMQKSDKPGVELFVFSYCPYGLQAEKGFVPVYNLLKSKADIDVVFIGAMHGKYEEKESLRQLCIKKNYGMDKFMAYIEKFIGDTAIGRCSSNENCSKPLAEKIMTSLGIDVNKINSCMASTEVQALYKADQARASELGVSGSPTLVINNVQVSSGRSSSALLSSICSAFNTAPAECSQSLSSANPSAGFGYEASASSGSASCG